MSIIFLCERGVRSSAVISAADATKRRLGGGNNGTIPVNGDGGGGGGGGGSSGGAAGREGTGGGGGGGGGSSPGAPANATGSKNAMPDISVSKAEPASKPSLAGSADGDKVRGDSKYHFKVISIIA